MNVPIRMIGIATTLFWVFLVIFGITAIYSAKDLGFSFGNSEVTVTPSGQLIFSQPITVTNKGFYDIGLFNISTRVFDATGSAIAEAFSSIPMIARGSEATVTHNITISVGDLLQNYTQFLFEDAQFSVGETVGMQVAGMIPVQAEDSFTMPWGAPLYHLTIGDPMAAMYNVTHSHVTVPINFENHAMFDLMGTMRLRLFSDSPSGSSLIGEADSAVNTPQHNSYNENIDLYVPSDSLLSVGSSLAGHGELYFETSMFSCGPVILSYGG